MNELESITEETAIVRQQLYEKLDHEIRDTLLDFVRCGRALKEMRDSQAYLAKYPTFEEYVKGEVSGLVITKAQEKIRNAMIYDSLGPQEWCPENEAQVRMLAHAAVFKEEVRKITGPSGKERTIKQPVAVKNAKQVQKIWSKVQKDYEDQRKREETEGKTPRKLTSSFIIDRLPDDFKPQHILGRRSSNTCTALISTIDKLPKFVESRNLLGDGRFAAIQEKENWSGDDKQQLRDAIAESRSLLDAIDRML